MSNKIKMCLEVDLTKTVSVLNKYFNVTLPNEYIVGIINNSEKLLEEILDGSIGDTYARDLLIDEVVKSLPDSEGMYWPANGASKAKSEEFYTWFINGIERVGGTFGEIS